MAAHRPGVSIPNQGLRDRDAAARHGVNPPRDVDQGPLYDGHDVLFPTDDGKAVVGVCPCRFVIVEDCHGNGRPACVGCGSYLEAS